VNKLLQFILRTESVSANLSFSSLTVWLCRLYKQENRSQNLYLCVSGIPGDCRTDNLTIIVYIN